MSGQDIYTDWDAGKGKGNYVPPTAQQSQDIKDTIKKNINKGKKKGKGGIPMAQRTTNKVNV